MIKKHTVLLLGVAFCSFCQNLFSNLTTLQHYDPSPIYSANNHLMPPNSHIVALKKARKKDMKPDHKRTVGINISGFVQGACRARNSTGCKHHQSDCSLTTTTSRELELGNFRGTPYAMGLFLGNDPKGNSIWDTSIETTALPTLSLFDNNNITALTYDTSAANTSTNGSINRTALPPCLKNIAQVFAGIVDPFTGNAATTNDLKLDSAFMFDPTPSGGTQILTTDSTVPSIFSEKKLEDDTVFFGAYSLPIDYKKYGLRIELTTEFNDHIGLTIQTGFSNIKHTTTGLVSLSNGNYDASTPSTSLYGQLNSRVDAGGGNPATTPNTTVQNFFDKFISNNADQILSADCGINQEACNFDEYSIEDVRMILSLKNTYDLDRYTKHEEDQDDWPEMLFTPYCWLGGSFPVGDKKNYNQLLSLPFGNNGHGSVGGAIGMLFDFKELIEVGFEGGATHFLSKKEYRPFPNHKLQRVLYPYRTDVITDPGINWQFKAHMNAYQFMKHVSFWASYEFIEHRRDHYTVCGNNTVNKTFTVTNGGNSTTVGSRTERIFIPEVLECNSDWRAQFINLGLIFDIQPGMQASIAWQQPISPRNAYYPVSIMGSFSFVF